MNCRSVNNSIIDLPPFSHPHVLRPCAVMARVTIWESYHSDIGNQKEHLSSFRSYFQFSFLRPWKGTFPQTETIFHQYFINKEFVHWEGRRMVFCQECPTPALLQPNLARRTHGQRACLRCPDRGSVLPWWWKRTESLQDWVKEGEGIPGLLV